ncbi:MAG TPA: efflux RND transporter periplasmic adaptor subunit [Caulobacteraceae bacterium]|nr:efflux RND transporter periplasmic adaptor subunit [Caulobacteraceae bacterium]
MRQNCILPPRGAAARTVVVAAALSALLAGCGGARPPAARPPPTVAVVTIEPQAVTLTAELPGRTSPYEIADVRPQVGGIILERRFVEGSLVRAGQVLYRIEPAPYRAAYDQATAQLANAEANLVTTRLKAARYADLVKIHAVSSQDADDAEAAFKQAGATVMQDQASVEAARINLGFTRVTAPITGRIGISAVTKGALVTASQATALDTIQRLDPIYVDIAQSAAQVLALRQQMARGGLDASGAAGAQVRLTLDDGSAYPAAGRMQFTDVTVDQTTGAVTLRAVFPNPSGLLLPGMYVRATVVEGVDPAGLLVPQQGVGRDQKGNPTALVVGPDGVVQLRQLQVGQTVGDKWLVTSGLAAGDRVIVEGLQSARPGAKVRAVAAGVLP